MTPSMYFKGLKTHLEKKRNLKKPSDELKGKQWKDFVDLVTYAYKYVPFYRNLYARVGFVPSDLKTPADLASVPTVRKEMLQREETDQLLGEGYHPDKLVCKTTSGSSGEPLYVCYTPEDRIYRTIDHLRIFFYNGMGLRDRIAQITHRKVPDFRYAFQKLGFLPIEFVKLVSNPPEQQLDQLKDINPAVLHANASSIVLLAAEIKKRGHCPIHPKLIFTTGELLGPDDRVLIEQTFNVCPRDIYGILEMGDVAWQCSETKGYHLNLDSFLAEVEVDRRQAEPSEIGRLIITNLHSRAMPFIRYEVGDLVTAPREDCCPCGCTFPLIEVVQGREDDWLYSADGNRVSSFIFLISIKGVKQYRMIQKDYGQVLVEILPGSDFDDMTLKRVKSYVIGQLGSMGSGMTVDVSKVNHLAQQSGKMRRLISEINHPSP